MFIGGCSLTFWLFDAVSVLTGGLVVISVALELSRGSSKI